MAADFPFHPPLDLQELPRWSSWPARLLGLEQWTTVERTTAKIEQEYNKEKYADCRKYVIDHLGVSPEDLKRFEVKVPWSRPSTGCVPSRR